MVFQNAKGTRDYLPQEMIALQELMDKLRHIFELYGFNPMSTPLLERFDVLSAKYAGGAEILKETFRLQDQGGRDLGLRYDLTVPFSRVVAQHPELKMPFKRYQIEKVYRDGPVGPGRYREFWQCDVDVVGSSYMEADAELLAITQRFFSAIGLPVTVFVNNRKVLNSLLSALGVEDSDAVITILDKSDKQPREALATELTELGVDATKVFDFFDSLQAQDDNMLRLDSCAELVQNKEGEQGVSAFRDLLILCDQLNVNVTFHPMLARGLSYYTDTVFEVVPTKSKITSTVAAGGRYNNMITHFIDNGKEYPAVGISFGLSRIMDALDVQHSKAAVADVFIVSAGEDSYARSVAEQLRSASIRSEVDLLRRSLRKNFDYARIKGIEHVIVVGEEERKSGNVTLKHLESGQQDIISIQEALQRLHHAVGRD